MKLLAIETATEACSAALLIDDEIRLKYEVAPRKHNELILPMCDALLAEAQIKQTDLNVIAFGRGPGAFTGVRIAAGVTQGIAYALDLPVIPVSTLHALAQYMSTRTDSSLLFPAIDARMREIYWGLYKRQDGDIVHVQGEERVQKPEEVSVTISSPCYGAGTGWAAYESILRTRLGNQVIDIDPAALPSAREVALIGKAYYKQGKTVAPEKALPVYLRDHVADVPEHKSNLT